MRILGAVFFLSFLEGKLKIFTQMLRSIFFKKSWRMRIISARIFSKFFGGKIKNFGKDYHESKFQHNFAKKHF